VNFFTESFSET